MAGKILVFGATGNVGAPLIRQLTSAGEIVKAVSRTGKPVSGTEPVAFDDGKASNLDTLFDGVDRTYLLLPSGYPDAKGLLSPIVQVAASRGVKVVLESVLGVDADDNIPYRQVALLLERSGVPFVILRPNWFADNFHTFWKADITHGKTLLPAGEGKTSFIDAREIAASAAAVLASDQHDGHAFDLTGPEALSYADAAKILSSVTGKSLEQSPVSDEAFIEMLTRGGVSREYATMLVSIFYPVRKGFTAKVTDHVATLTDVGPRTLTAYATDQSSVYVGKWLQPLATMGREYEQRPRIFRRSAK